MTSVADAASPLVLSLGVIRPYKGLEFLLRSWPHVTTPNAQLVVAGGGDPAYAAQLVELARQLDLGDSVLFRIGYVSDADHDALHRACDVVVLPYREISQSGALMTAMAYGRPVVASDIGGFREVIDSGRNGVLVTYGDTAAMAAAVSALLDDPQRRAEIGAAALADVRSTFSWDSIARSTMDCYMRAVKDTQGAPDGSDGVRRLR